MFKYLLLYITCAVTTFSFANEFGLAVENIDVKQLQKELEIKQELSRTSPRIEAEEIHFEIIQIQQKIELLSRDVKVRQINGGGEPH